MAVLHRRDRYFESMGGVCVAVGDGGESWVSFEVHAYSTRHRVWPLKASTVTAVTRLRCE